MERDVDMESKDLASPPSIQKSFAPLLHIMLREFRF